jgi:hypothetical protein
MIAIECEDGQIPVYDDNDVCALACRDPDDSDDDHDDGVVCPAIWVECEDGAEPVDVDGDGCALECPRR